MSGRFILLLIHHPRKLQMFIILSSIHVIDYVKTYVRTSGQVKLEVVFGILRYQGNRLP